MKIIMRISLVVIIVWLGACSAWSDATEISGEHYHLAITFEPDLPQVGSAVAMKLLVSDKAGNSQKGCTVVLRQHMPGMGMSVDRLSFPFTSDGEGYFLSSSAPFTMGGGWVLAFKVNCGGLAEEIGLPMELAWPE